MRTICSFLATLAFICVEAAAEQTAPGAADDPTVRGHVFLVVLEPGPAWLAGKPVAEQPLREHGRYLLERYAEGVIQEAGPFTDDTGGALIYRAGSRAEVEALVAADPAVANGVMVPRIYPWLLREWDYYLQRSATGGSGGAQANDSGTR